MASLIYSSANNSQDSADGGRSNTSTAHGLSGLRDCMAISNEEYNGIVLCAQLHIPKQCLKMSSCIKLIYMVDHNKLNEPIRERSVLPYPVQRVTFFGDSLHPYMGVD